MRVRRISRRTFKASCKRLEALSGAFVAAEKETPLRAYDNIRKSLREGPFDQVCALNFISKSPGLFFCTNLLALYSCFAAP